MILELRSFRKAVSGLEKGVERSRKKPNDTEFRDAVILRFKYTFELCWKFIQRWLRVNRSPDEAEAVTRKVLFRIAADNQLIEDPIRWFEYGEARNLTSHTYDEAKAKEVYETALEFLPDARNLLEKLTQNND